MKNGFRRYKHYTVIYLERHDGSVLRTLVSNVDFERVAALDVQWYPSLERGKWYACARNPTGKVTRMARFIMDAPTGSMVDHQHGDTLDNRRERLRIVDRSGNCLNLVRKSRGKTGYRGVFESTSSVGFEARIVVNKKRVKCGFHSTAEAAARAVLTKLREHDPVAAENYERTHFPHAA